MERPVCAAIPAGYFTMGCEQGRDEEKPEHRTWVDAFEMAVHQVRNRDYAAFLAATGSAAPAQWNDSHFNHSDQPVVSVSWFEAAAYCEWLGREYGRLYRLPTEAEWERAARGGSEGSLYVWGDEAPGGRAEYIRRWGGVIDGPRPVGEEAPNAFGVFDIGENVHEWCADWFDRNYYAVAAERNPSGPASGELRGAGRGGITSK